MNGSFLRILSTFLISFSLVSSQNIALAAGDENPTPEIPEVPQTQITTDAQGYSQEEGGYSLIKEVRLTSDFVSDLATLSASSFGVDMVMLCSTLGYDMYAYLAGSAAYFAMLIAANRNLRDAQEGQLVHISGDKAVDVTALETLKSGEEERLKATRLKFAGQITMTTTYVIAEIIAILQSIYGEYGPGASCGGANDGFLGTMASTAFVAFLQSLSGSSGAMSIIATAITLAKTQYTEFALNLMNDTTSRAIFYGASIVIGGVGIGITGSKKSKINDNIRDIQVMIDSYKATTPNSTLSTGGGGTTGGDWNNEFPELTVPGGANGGPSNPGDDALRSLSDIKIKEIKLPTSINSPTLANSVAGLNTISRAMSSGRYNDAITAASGLSQNLAKLKEISKDLKLKLNEKLKKAGKPPIDFTAKSQSLAEKLNNAAGNAAQQAGAQNSLSKKAEPKKEETKAAGGAQQGAVVAAAQAPALVEESLFEEGWNEDDQLMEIASSSPKQNLNDYVVNQNDIHGDRSQSIFSLLSVRYLKTAYPQLLEEAK